MHTFSSKEQVKNLDQKISNFLAQHPKRAGSKAPKLAIVQIGNNAESQVYVNLKKKFCKKFNIPVQVFNIPSEQEDSKIIDRVRKIFAQKEISGGIVQLPLPRASLEPVLGVIPVEKDVDLLSPEACRQFYAGEFFRLPPTVRAFDYFVRYYNLEFERLSIGVVGYGDLVGKPIAHYATLMGADTRAIGCYEGGSKLSYQLVISSAGVPNLVDPHDLEEDAYFIDFGSSRVNGKTVGDLDMSKDLTHLAAISPSPGGMGPLVVRFLVMNFLGI